MWRYASRVTDRSRDGAGEDGTTACESEKVSENRPVRSRIKDYRQLESGDRPCRRMCVSESRRPQAPGGSSRGDDCRPGLSASREEMGSLTAVGPCERPGGPHGSAVNR